MSLDKFKTKVMENTDDGVKSFDFVVDDPNADFETMKMDDLTRAKFQMKVNNKLYDVYPDLRSLTGSGKHYLESTKYKKELEKL